MRRFRSALLILSAVWAVLKFVYFLLDLYGNYQTALGLYSRSPSLIKTALDFLASPLFPILLIALAGILWSLDWLHQKSREHANTSPLPDAIKAVQDAYLEGKRLAERVRSLDFRKPPVSEVRRWHRNADHIVKSKALENQVPANFFSKWLDTRLADTAEFRATYRMKFHRFPPENFESSYRKMIDRIDKLNSLMNHFDNLR